MHIEPNYSNKTKFTQDLEQLLHLTNVNINEAYGLYHADTDSYIKINNHSIFSTKEELQSAILENQPQIIYQLLLILLKQYCKTYKIKFDLDDYDLIDEFYGYLGYDLELYHLSENILIGTSSLQEALKKHI